MSRVTLLDTYPRDPASGAEVRSLFAHNAVIRAVYFGMQWRPTLISAPKIEAALGLGSASFGKGAAPAVGQVQIAIGESPELAGLVWHGARAYLQSAPIPRIADPLDSDFGPARPLRVDAASAESGVLTLTFIDAGAPLRVAAASARFGTTGNAVLDAAGADLDGKVVPIGYGELLNIPAQLVDRAYNIWLLHGRPSQHIHALYDGGAPLTAGAARADIASLRASVPPDGYFDWCLDADGITLVRPWTKPVYPLTADLRAAGPVTTAMIAEALVSSRTTVAFKAGTVAALDALNSGYSQLYLSDDTEIDVILDQLMAGLGCWWRIDASGELELGRYDYGAAVDVIDATDVISVKRESVLLPMRRFQLGYGRNWRVQSEGEIASIILEGGTTYTWYAWANSPDGVIDFTTDAPGERAFQGISANRLTETPGSDPDDYVWTPYKGPPAFGLVVRGAAVLASDLVIFTGGGWGAGGGWTTAGFNGGAVVTFQAMGVVSAYMVGLNADPTADDNWPSIDFAIYVNELGGAAIYESGAYIGHIVPDGGGVGTSTFSVAYDNRAVRYYLNGGLVREVGAGAGRTFWADMAGYAGRVRITAWSPQGAVGEDGEDGDDGDPGEDGLTISVQPGSILILCNSAWVPNAGELPQSVQLTVYSGGTDVTTAAGYSSSSSGIAGFSDNGGGNFAFGGVTLASAYVDLTANYGGKVGRVRVPIKKAREGANSNRAVDTSIGLNDSDTYSGLAEGGPLTLAVGPGTVDLSAHVEFGSSASGVRIAGKFQYRTTPGSGAWTDIGGEVDADFNALPGEPSMLDIYQSLSGPGTPNNWEFRLALRRSAGAAGRLIPSGPGNLFVVEQA